ncbi:MAG: PilN domain-containing protein [Candidatus Riflebacteria bacterium]|nr:PilN domain-containing protein [Candidatus Riflebacteria bacterium]
MKYQFDLLPKEYKSLPRDTLGIAMALLTILVTISAIGSMSIKNHSELSAVQAQVDGMDTQVRDMVEKTGALQPPISEINSLKNSITFINENLDTPGTSLVDFLATLEASVPDRVVITDISPKNFTNIKQNFTLSGEASTIFDVLEFANRLEQSGKFTAMLKSTANVTQDEGSVQKFTLDFTYLATKRK